MLVFETPRQWIGLIIAAAVCGYALWKGGRPERIGGAAILAAWIGVPFAVDTRNWDAPQWVLLAAEVPLLIVLGWLALRSERWWPMWAASLQLLGMLMAVIIAVDPRVRPIAYMTAAGLWSYLVLLALVIGVAREARRGREE